MNAFPNSKSNNVFLTIMQRQGIQFPHYKKALIAITAILLLIALPVKATEYQGKVVKISDGDTIHFKYMGGQLKNRLAEIDAPEKKQPWGRKSKQALSDLIAGKHIKFVQQATDRYGRLVGRLYLDNIDVNAEMIKQGNAWVYLK